MSEASTLTYDIIGCVNFRYVSLRCFQLKVDMRLFLRVFAKQRTSLRCTCDPFLRLRIKACKQQKLVHQPWTDDVAVVAGYEGAEFANFWMGHVLLSHLSLVACSSLHWTLGGFGEVVLQLVMLRCARSVRLST